MNLGCLGSDNAERSYQLRLIALPIVPDYLVFQLSKRQLNTLQTVVLSSNHEEENMVKPHG